MMLVVLDTNVVISAIFWPRSTARRALAGLARRQYAAAISRELFDEYAGVAARFREQFPRTNPAGSLGWLQAKCLWVEPTPLGKPRSRDPKDDPVLATALAVRARYLVAGDRDLLALEKPFGIEIVTPIQFLSQIEVGPENLCRSSGEGGPALPASHRAEERLTHRPEWAVG